MQVMSLHRVIAQHMMQFYYFYLRKASTQWLTAITVWHSRAYKAQLHLHRKLERRSVVPSFSIRQISRCQTKQEEGTNYTCRRP